MEIKEKIRLFINENLNVFDDEAEYTDDDNIFEMGFVNSLFAMKLVSYIEKEYNVAISNDDLDIKNFRSISRIVAFIEKKIN